ncbi:hypothetical protein ABKN59_010828 [Abortiporus biennis]
MALLGLFHKKDKQKSSRSNTPSKAETSAASVSDATSIAETDRKKSIPQINIDDLPAFRPPQIPYSPTSRSEANVNQIRPPPSKASLFGGYAESDETNITDVPASTSNHNSAKKSGGLFAWAHRDRKKSKPSEPLPELKVDLGSDSFNLRSFRHIGAESPHSIDVPRPTSSLSPTYMTPPARPRPRENSVNSDSSQRVSVAAFREMAARTRNNTPSPSLRPPSSVDLSSPSHLRPPLTTRPGQTRNSTARALSSATSSDSSESEESESDDSTGSATLRPNRDNTITKRSTKASTELGHRTTRTTPSPGQSRPRLSVGQSDSAQIGRGNGNQVMSRPRASASTSALHPNAAAKRASLRAASATQPPLPVVAPSRRKTADSDSDASTSSDSEDSDDAPLAKFVIPRRPGSSASNATTSSRPRAPSKPLIDITAMTTPPIPSLTSSPSDQSPSPPEKEKEEKTRPTHSSKPSLGDRLARLAQNVNTKSIENLSDVSPIGRRSLDARPMLEPERERGRTPPSRSQTAPLGTLDSSTSSPLATLNISPPSPSAARKINRRSLSSPNAAVFDLTDTTPIVPTPIRERSPPPAFSVTSRPISTFSQSSKDALTSNQNTPQTTHSSPQDIAQTQPQHTHTSSSTSASTIRVVTSPPSSPPAVRLSHALHQPSSPAAASFMSTSSSGATLTVPGASEPILRNPPPRSSSRQSTLVPNSGAKPTDGFTGGGLLSTPAADPATHKKPEMPSYARGGMSNSPPSQTRNGRTRSSTMEPKLESHPHRYAESLAPSSARKASNVETMSTKTVPTPPRISTSSVTTTPPSSTSRPRSSTVNHIPSPSSGLPPPKPFATKSAMRGNSPASSTGDSSSGRTPLTPADGSDIGHNGKHGGSSGVSVSGSSGLSHPASAISRKKAPGEGHRKRPSVTFDDVSDKEMRNDEERRKERRRSEAKAAIELGKVVNGQISLDDDDEDEDAPLNPSMGPRMSMANPMMNFTPATPIAWRPPSSVMGSPMSAQSFSMFPMPPPNADPAFLVAHQQAMMVAKQAYQYAVAQQAMAQANEEWERGSTATSAYGGFGGGMGMGGMGGMNMNPMGMPMGGMFGNPYAMGMQGWPGAGMMFPSSAQSMYAGSVIGGSEMNFGGGGGGGGGWGSKSEYGGPTSNRNSAMLRQRQESHAPSSQSVVGGASSSQQQNRPGPRPRTKTAPSSRQAPPPSSWKASPQRPL